MNQETVTSTPSYRLLTIPISHYCEKARWALDWLKIPYLEERHVPLFHRLATRTYAGKSVPVLVTKEGAFVDSTEILHYLDATGSRRLYPAQSDLRREVDELEELFDTKLGIYTRCWAYFYRLDDRQAVRRAWCEGTPKLEQVGFALAFPLMRRVAKKAYNVTPDSAATCLKGIRRIFETVNQRLSDGRRYLVGDNFSAADLTFAALTAPVLLPPEHPMKPPQLNQINPEMATIIQELRETQAGAYALRLYREQRYSSRVR